MELFKYALFGVTGISMIFWVAVIALWHTYMFPRLFKEDHENSYIQKNQKKFPSFKIKPSGIYDRSKYSFKSFVLADFSPIEKGYGVNRLYTFILLSLGFMSFMLISYGLNSGFSMFVYAQ